MQIRKFEQSDLDKIVEQEKQKQEGDNNEYFIDDNTVTFYDGDMICAIVRPWYEDGGSIHLSAMIGANVKRKMVPLYKVGKRWIKSLLVEDGIYRIQMHTQSDFEQANRFALQLGFQFEGKMRKFYFGKDYNLFSMVKE